MKKLALAALALVPLAGGCYGGYYARGYYPAYRPSYVRVYGPPVYAAPAPVYAAPAPVYVRPGPVVVGPPGGGYGGYYRRY